MDYTPLKGRWATLSFIAVIALGATALSLRVENGLGDIGVKTHAAVEQMHGERHSESEQIVVVNADGSPRQKEMSATPADGNLLGQAIETDASTLAVIENSPRNEAETGWGAEDSSIQNPVGIRIE